MFLRFSHSILLCRSTQRGKDNPSRRRLTFEIDFWAPVTVFDCVVPPHGGRTVHNVTVYFWYMFLSSSHSIWLRRSTPRVKDSPPRYCLLLIHVSEFQSQYLTASFHTKGEGQSITWRNPLEQMRKVLHSLDLQYWYSPSAKPVQFFTQFNNFTPVNTKTILSNKSTVTYT